MTKKRTRRVPVVVAAEAAECSLACLTMVARAFGHDVDLYSLRRRFGLSLSGASLRTLLRVAGELDLQTKALRLEVDDLDGIEGPLILHWELRHFVVLVKVARHRFLVHDPGAGRRWLSREEICRSFTGVAICFQTNSSFTPLTARARAPFSNLWSGLRGGISSAGLVLTVSLTAQLLYFLAPFQLQIVVDEAFGQNSTRALPALFAAFAVLAGLRLLVEILRATVTQRLAASLSFQLARNVVGHMLRLPPSYFEKRHLGDVMSRLNSTTALQDALTRGAATIVVDGAFGIIAIALLFLYAPRFAAIALSAFVLNIGVRTLFYPQVRAKTLEQVVLAAMERTHVLESLRAIATIKLLGGENEREAGWKSRFASYANHSAWLAKITNIQQFVQNAVESTATSLIIYLSTLEIIRGDGFTIGMLVAFLTLRQNFGDRANAVLKEAFQLRLLGVHLERLADVVLTEPEEEEDRAAPRHPHLFSLRGVGFSYGYGDRMIIRNLDLTISPGEFIAITGPSGVGKTTILKMILGYQDPIEGDVLIDGAKPTGTVWNAWRSQIGVVMQQDHLLSGSIAENIAGFADDLNMPRVHEVAQLVGLANDIQLLPEKYLTQIGGTGHQLSGGQRQRLLIARALYNKPNILILDEGTANLDKLSEERIADLVAGLEITRIVVAHRPALVRRAQRTLRLGANHSIEEFTPPLVLAAEQRPTPPTLQVSA